ncbi:related to SAM-dependent methyltransferases [Rhynchosporium secalis]|uniref:Sterol 24-C-methyltransferase n=1 Tax=Rhynchosporium secalis TaxID=38038 RepID=A0A1E1MHF2_RHYSE|nr:related to SAM-dependent methyltransferases [Rhynchosporium secalis]
MTQDATPPTDRDPPSIYAIKDRAAVPKFADRDSGTTKPYDSGLRYREVWGSADLSNLTEEQRIARNQHADKLNEAYYDFITDHYQGGWGNKFHFCGYYPGESWDQAQARHEHHLALSMGMAAGMKVLDIGCGVGGPAREMAKFTGCRVTGVTINDLHVERSNELNRECGMQDQVNMVKGNFVDLPFKDGEFDQAYATEALCCAPDMLKAYQEAFRVLKPGGVLGMLDWVLTDKYDDGNEMHRKIRNEVERGGSVPLLTSVKAHVQALEEAGFEIVVENDRATDKSNPIGWWTTLDGQKYDGMTWVDRFYCFMLTPLAYNTVWFLWKILDVLHLCHPARMEALETVSMCVYSCRDGGREGIFSPMHLFVAKKPEIEKDK